METIFYHNYCYYDNTFHGILTEVQKKKKNVTFERNNTFN